MEFSSWCHRPGQKTVNIHCSKIGGFGQSILASFPVFSWGPPLPFFTLCCCWERCYKTRCRVWNLSSASLLGKCFKLEKSQKKIRHLAEWLSKLNVKKLKRRMNIVSQDWSQTLVTSHLHGKQVIPCVPVVEFLMTHAKGSYQTLSEGRFVN